MSGARFGAFGQAGELFIGQVELSHQAVSRRLDPTYVQRVNWLFKPMEQLLFRAFSLPSFWFGLILKLRH